METAFPLTALQREKHFAAAVEVAEPFGMLGVLEVAPGVVVDALEPLQALRVAGQAVAFIVEMRVSMCTHHSFWSHSSSWGGQPLRSMK